MSWLSKAIRSPVGGLLTGAALNALIPGGGLIAQGLRMGAGSAISNALNRRRSGGGGDAATGGAGQDLGGAYNEAIGQEKLGPRGPGYEGLMQQDIGASYGKYMDGAASRYKEILGEENDKLTESAVGRGRLDTGFYDQDRGELAESVAGEFAAESSRAALQTAGMETDRLRSVAGIDESSRDRYLDLVVGGLDRAQAASNAKRAERASTRNSVIGVVGDIAGSVISDQLRNRRRRGSTSTASTYDPAGV